MQKTSFAIVLALTLSLAVSEYVIYPEAYAKAPVTLCNDSELTCGNVSQLVFGSSTSSGLALYSYDKSEHGYNNTWSVYTRRINMTDLSVTGNATYSSYTSPSWMSSIYDRMNSGYDIYTEVEVVDNISQVFLYRTKIEGGIPLPRVQLTSNTNSSHRPNLVGLQVLPESIVCFVYVADKKVNVSTITFDGSVISKETTLTTNYNKHLNQERFLQSVSGGALSYTKVLALWVLDKPHDGNAYAEAVYDSNTGVVTAIKEIEFNITYFYDFSCQPFSTDKEIYGVLCDGITQEAKRRIYVGIFSNSSETIKVVTLTDIIGLVREVVPYNGYIALMFRHVYERVWYTYTYAIYDLNTLMAIKNPTIYLAIRIKEHSYSIKKHIPGAGLFILHATQRDYPNYGAMNIKVGLLLDYQIGFDSNVMNMTNDSKKIDFPKAQEETPQMFLDFI